MPVASPAASPAPTTPPLGWAGWPSGTKSIALVVDDSNAPITPYVYWIVFNISPATSDILEGQLPPGARQARNSAGTAGYEPPCPGSAGHTYRFTVYALKSRIDLPSGAPLQSAWRAIAAAAIGRGRMTASASPECPACPYRRGSSRITRHVSLMSVTMLRTSAGLGCSRLMGAGSRNGRACLASTNARPCFAGWCCMSFMSRRPSRDDNRDDRGSAADARFRGDRDYDDNWSPDEYFSPQDIRGTRAAPSRGSRGGGDFDAGYGGGPQGAGRGRARSPSDDYGPGDTPRGRHAPPGDDGREDYGQRDYGQGRETTTPAATRRAASTPAPTTPAVSAPGATGSAAMARTPRTRARPAGGQVPAGAARRRTRPSVVSASCA